MKVLISNDAVKIVWHGWSEASWGQSTRKVWTPSAFRWIFWIGPLEIRRWKAKR